MSTRARLRSKAATKRRVKSRAKSTIRPKPVAKAVTVRSTGRPARISMRKDATVVSHSEFLADVIGSAAFNLRGFPLNPGNADIFPYLSEIAMRFEYYHFRKLKFRYEPSCSTLTAGSIYMAIDYDNSDNAPADKVTFMQNMNAVRSAPYDHAEMGMVPIANAAQVRRFTLDRAPPPNADPKMYNLGTALFATQGNTDGTAVGELYVDYEVEFFVPQGQSNFDTSAVIDSIGGRDALNIYQQATVRQDAKRPIVGVPGVNAAVPPGVNQNSFQILKEGVYNVAVTLASSINPAASLNQLGFATYTGSGITITEDQATPTNFSTSSGNTTMGRCRVVYNPTQVTNQSLAGFLYVGATLALATTGLTLANLCRTRVTAATAPEDIELLPVQV